MELKKTELKVLFKVPKTTKQYEENAVYLTKPQLVAYFDCNHERITKAKRMKYIKVPELKQYPFSINASLQSYIPRDPGINTRGIESALKYMSSVVGCENVEKTKVITRSGALVHLMELIQNRSIFNKQLRVSRFNNNLYMLLSNDERPSELESVNTHHLQFAQMLLADSPHSTPKYTDPCDENVRLIGVFRASFGKYDMIYSKEIQGVMEEEIITDFDDLDAINNRRLVAIKQMWKSLKNKDNKFLRIWLQSYLGNVRDIFVGFKNESGTIDEPIKHILPKDLPKNCYWKPSISTGFLYYFLQHVEKLMSSVNCPNTVYEFNYDAKTFCFTYAIFEGKTEKSFIPKEYQEVCQSL